MYSKTQRLNDWARMLSEMYGSSQNYSRSPFEIHAHLTEVSGTLGKHLLKRRAVDTSIEFLPKVFAWAIALVNKVGPQSNLEELILHKYPGVCPYCQVTVCICWKAGKPPMNEESLRKAYFQNAKGIGRSIDDFQLMFRTIYEQSWATGTTEEVVRMMHTRLIEELAEIAEALRFHHLYPSNFDNEMADFLAWWFALGSTIHRLKEGRPMLLSSDVLWEAYPGFCRICELLPCFCRPSPVRALISKPLPGQLELIDGLTSLFNQRAYGEHRISAAKNIFPLAVPAACVRIDVDDFKQVNESYGHNAGDEVLKHIATALRKKARERDRVYRVGGDEFAILCSDFSVNESVGMMERVAAELRARPALVTGKDGKEVKAAVTLSIGIAACSKVHELDEAFALADKAAGQSKADGKNRTTISSESRASGNLNE